MGDLKVFSTQGRLNRMPYNIYSLALIVVSFIMSMLCESLKERFVIMNESDFIGKVSESDLDIMIACTLLIIVIAILMIIGELTLTIRRMHDLNLSGWYYLLFFVPNILTANAYDNKSLLIILIFLVLNLIPLILGLCLVFKRGTAGENKYGADPLSE